MTRKCEIKAIRPIGVAAAMLIAGFAHFNVIWNHFYGGVPKLFDTGWYADLVYRQTLALKNPGAVVFGVIQESFHATHFSPALWMLSLPTYVIPVGPTTWLAVIEGSKHVCVVLVVAAVIRAGYHRRSQASLPGEKASPVLVLFLAPFTGVFLAAASYPHFETWFVPGALGFFGLLFCRRYRWAAGVMAFTLMIREDMGFHLCGLLLVVVVLAAWERRTVDAEIRRWLLFAAAAFLFSVIALTIPAVFFPGDDAFGRIYLGDPPLAHLDGAFLRQRLAYIAVNRAFLWWPLVVYAGWATVSRRWWVLGGYLAFVPWFLLHLMAVQVSAGTLALYYAFPYSLAILWPLVGVLGFERGSSRHAHVMPWVATAILASIGGFFATGNGLSLIRDMLAPRLGTRAALHDTTSRLAALVEEDVPVALDDALLAHAPRRFSARNHYGQTERPVKVAALYRNGRQTQIAYETAEALPYSYEIDGTQAIVASAEPLDWPHLTPVSDHPRSVLAFLQPTMGELAWDLPDGARDTLSLTSLPWFLPGIRPHAVELVLSIESVPPGTEPLSWTVRATNSGHILARRGIALEAARFADREVVSKIQLNLPAEPQGGIGIAIGTPAGTRGRVTDIRLYPSSDGDGGPNSHPKESH